MASPSAATEEKALAGEFKQTFRSLKHRNFRIYFFGQMISLFGTWAQQLALSWLVYRMTKSAFLLGIVEFATLFPVLILGLFGGLVADKFERKKILLITQTVAMTQAVVLAYLTLTNSVQVWHIIGLACVLGVVNAFEVPSRQSLIVNVVPREDLINAVSLNASIFNGTRIAGPAVAAVIIRFWGEGVCFALNAVSYLAALVALILIRPPKMEPSNASGLKSLVEGVNYALTTPQVKSVLRLTAGLSLFGAQIFVLLPIFAKEILKHDVEGFGALRAAAAVGSVVAALLLANRGASSMLARAIGFANLFFAIALACFSQSQFLWLSLPLAVVLGFCMTFQLSGSHSLLQLTVPEHLRGRLMSVWTMMLLGIAPIGSLSVGWLASHIGAPTTLLACSFCCLCSALIYLLFKK